MKNNEYSYSAWHRAMNHLVKGLERRQLGRTIWQTVNEYYERHMFEVCISVSRSSNLAKHATKVEPEKFREYERRNAAMAIADKLLDNGLFMKEDRTSTDGMEYSVYSVLVFGAPELTIKTKENVG